MEKIVHHTEKAPAAIGPYVQAVQVGNMMFASGQLGIDPVSGELMNGVENQTKQAMQNIGEILKNVGATYADIVKTTIFVKDLGDFGVVNAVYQTYFEGSYPARSCVQVAALPKGGLVEIECIVNVHD